MVRRFIIKGRGRWSRQKYGLTGSETYSGKNRRRGRRPHLPSPIISRCRRRRKSSSCCTSGGGLPASRGRITRRKVALPRHDKAVMLIFATQTATKPRRRRNSASWGDNGIVDHDVTSFVYEFGVLLVLVVKFIIYDLWKMLMNRVCQGKIISD